MSRYKKDHLIAKFIVSNLVVILVTLAQMSELPYSLILNGIAIYTWFFGVNFVAYIIETIFKHEHKHEKL